jgi:hypothetical protein
MTEVVEDVLVAQGGLEIIGGTFEQLRWLARFIGLEF